MITRLLGWTAVACTLVALWAIALRPTAQGREWVVAQANRDEGDPSVADPSTAEEAPFESLLPARVGGDAVAVPLVATAADEYRELRRERRLRGLVSGITIFVIAIFLGVELINRVPATLHTPLMSGSNAISGITVVGAIIVAGVGGRVAPFLGFLAVVLAMINVVGGFLVTHRMLMMFKRR